MEEIVKIILVKNLIELSDYYGYLESKMNEVMLEIGVNIENSCLETIEASEKVDSECNEFYFQFKYSNIGYFLGFSFETYNTGKQLTIDFYIDDKHEKYRMEFEESIHTRGGCVFSERLKIVLKNCFMYSDSSKKNKEWEKCIWLKDMQAQLFATSLYSTIYETENLFREFINTVLIKVYGADWWNEIVPKDLKDAQLERVSGYKAIVESLNDVEDYLMSVDVAALKKIVILKTSKWNPIYSKELEELIQILIKDINKPNDKYVKELVKILSKQLEEKDGLWNKYFSVYFPKEFLRDFEEFTKNRNHIAHNKIIDRGAYNIIKVSANKIKKGLAIANNKVCSLIKPIERIEVDRLEKKYDEEEYYAALEEIMESEAGVEICNEAEIYEIFNTAIEEFKDFVQDSLRFRTDIDILGLNELKYTEKSQELLMIKHLINAEEVNVYCVVEIDVAEGATSILKLSYEYHEQIEDYEVPYINGEVSFNSEQGCYMPETVDEFGELQLKIASNSLVEFVNKNLVNLKEKVESEMYRRIKEGSESPIIDECCCNCGECYICIDETIAQYGQCLNCGEINELHVCERCGHISTDSSEYMGISLCEYCYDKLRNE